MSDHAMSLVEECLICGKPLKYFDEAKELKCAICGKTVLSKASCVDGHFVCDECHSSGIGLIKTICLHDHSKSPYRIALHLMQNDFIHMHGPEHHVLVGSALLTAYKNAGGDINLEKTLNEMEERGKKVPGGACGFWGCCGAAISAGIFISIITGATPLASDAWGKANLATAVALTRIGKIGGPRCCKRDSFLSIQSTIDYVKANFGIEMEKEKIVCSFVDRNAQCIKERCPFFPGE